MSKLMSSLVAATIAGAFSVSAIAAVDAKAAPAAAPANASAVAEKPAAAPKKIHVARKHTFKAETKKADAAAMPAEPTKK